MTFERKKLNFACMIISAVLCCLFLILGLFFSILWDSDKKYKEEVALEGSQGHVDLDYRYYNYYRACYFLATLMFISAVIVAVNIKIKQPISNERIK